MTKGKKIITLLLTLVCAIGIIIALAVVTGAESVPAELSIDYRNLSFKESVYVKYAVKSNVSDVSLLIWTDAQEEYVYGTQETEITDSYTDTIGGEKYYVFDYKGISAKEMGDAIYARAYANVGGKAYYSEITKYSVLQYVYNWTGKTGDLDDDEDFVNLLNNMLLYGASAQTYFNYKTDRLVTEDFYQVIVEGGLLGDKTTDGLYLEDDIVTITAPLTDASGAAFSHWINSDGRKVSTDATAEIVVSNRNEVYTAVYVNYSVGLEFDSNGDGTCYLIGIGDCTDTEVVIPPVYDGDTVIGIDNNAFEGEAITSISLPSTIEEIGRNAFLNCTSLKDVYYDGSKADFEKVSVTARGNDTFLAATFHFSVATKYTVTFVDYDGATLKTESVAEGQSATAPTVPEREGYTFAGWDKDFSNITADVTVTATYELVGYDEPTIVVNNAKASISEGTVKVVIDVHENPGIASLKFAISFDDSILKLTAVEFGADFGAFVTAPEPFGNPQNVSLMSPMSEISADGAFVTLTFEIIGEVTVGDVIDISLDLDEENIFDGDFTPLTFAAINGKITFEE